MKYEIDQALIGKWEKNLALLLDLISYETGYIIQICENKHKIIVGQEFDNETKNMELKNVKDHLIQSYDHYSYSANIRVNSSDANGFKELVNIHPAYNRIYSSPIRNRNNQLFGYLVLLGKNDNRQTEKHQEIVNYFTSTFEDQLELHISENQRNQKQDTYYQLISDMTSEGIIIHRSGTIVEVNKSCEKIFGLTRSQMIGKEIFGYIIPPKYYQMVIKKQQKEHNEPYEVDYKNFKGELLNLEVEAKEIFLTGRKYRFIRIKDLTEQKKAKADLIRQEKNYHTIFNSAKDAIVIHEAATGKVINANAAVSELYGYDLKEAKSLNIIDASCGEPPYSEKEINQWIAKARKEGPQTFEWLAKKKTGELFWVEVSLSLTDIDGKPSLVSAIRDIDDKKKIKDALLESENKYHSIFEGSRDGIAFVDLQGYFVDSNKAFINLTGYTKEELRGMNFLEMTPKKWHNFEQKEIIEKQLLTKGFTDTYEKEYITKEGDVIPVELTICLLPSTYGRKELAWGVVRDISERKKSEAELYNYQKKLKNFVIDRTINLQEANESLKDEIKKHKATLEQLKESNRELHFSEQRFRLMAEHYPNGTINLIDKNYRIIMAGGDDYKWQHIDVKSIIGKDICDVLTMEKAAQARKYIKFALSGIHSEYENSHRGFHYKIIIVPILDNNGEINSVLLIVNNISELKNAENELKLAYSDMEYINNKLVDEIEERIQIEDRLKHTNEKLNKQKEELERTMEQLRKTQEQLIRSEKMASIGVLTAGIAHEINNPVNYISSGMVGLRKCQNKILDSLKHFRNININSLEKEFRSVVLEYEKSDIRQMIKYSGDMMKSIQEGIDKTVKIIDSMRMFTSSSENNKSLININSTIDTALVILYNMYKNRIKVIKKYDNIPNISGFAGKIDQAIMNVLSNAIQSIKGKGEIKILTRTIENGEKVMISIKDNGSGIPEKIKNKIFDPFYTTKGVGQGTGLGLYLTYNIIMEHNGHISFTSGEDSGTKFIIQLPVDPDIT